MYTIYCDMDGVLVNFAKGYKELTGTDIPTGGNLTWEPIDERGAEWWANLGWMHDGPILWNYIKKYRPKLLSAPSREDSSRVGKHEWVERELPGVPLLLRTAKHKKDFAAPDSILIDDSQTNIDSWTKNHGIGIRHFSDNVGKTLDKLKDLYKN